MPGNFYDLIQQAAAQPTSQGSQEAFAASPTPGPQGLGGKGPMGMAGKPSSGQPGMGAQPLVTPSPGAMTPAAALNPAAAGYAAYHPQPAPVAAPAGPTTAQSFQDVMQSLINYGSEAP